MIYCVTLLENNFRPVRFFTMNWFGSANSNILFKFKLGNAPTRLDVVVYVLLSFFNNSLKHLWPACGSQTTAICYICNSINKYARMREGNYLSFIACMCVWSCNCSFMNKTHFCILNFFLIVRT